VGNDLRARAAKRPRPACWQGGGGFVRDPGDDRLSRLRHYHGPGGLNGRVRDGNGCGPAGVVAGNPRGRRSGRAARRDDRGWSVTPGRGFSSVKTRPGGVSVRGSCRVGVWRVPRVATACRPRAWRQGSVTAFRRGKHFAITAGRTASLKRAAGRGGQAVGCWDWSAAAVARRTLPAHRPGRLPGAFALACRKPRLEEGFALRCLQRLSFPDLATRRCP
jgi:hypothetical protein